MGRYTELFAFSIYRETLGLQIAEVHTCSLIKTAGIVLTEISQHTPSMAGIEDFKETAENSSRAMDPFSEIKEIEREYGDACRVIADIGDFSYVVDVKLQINGLSIKFQIPA